MSETTSAEATNQLDDLSSPVAESREDAILRTLMNTLNTEAKEASATAEELEDKSDMQSQWYYGYSCAYAEAASMIANILNG